MPVVKPSIRLNQNKQPLIWRSVYCAWFGNKICFGVLVVGLWDEIDLQGGESWERGELLPAFWERERGRELRENGVSRVLVIFLVSLLYFPKWWFGHFPFLVVFFFFHFQKRVFENKIENAFSLFWKIKNRKRQRKRGLSLHSLIFNHAIFHKIILYINQFF